MSTERLPKPLEPWAAALGLFPHHLAVELGAWLPRLSMAIGPLRSSSAEGHDEPDGFDGLARRGPYERLLAAEWALADEFPDEFNRRAANGEHAFFRLAFRAPAGHRRCLVLLDSGPSQLGAPRLAHLASLLVLERRATEAKAEFLWGVLQQPPGRFLTGVSHASVEHWMRARSAAEPQDDDLGAWREAFDADASRDEVWLLGGHRLQRFGVPASLLTIAERDTSLSVDVRPRGGARREVQLPLPSDEVCTQLIRDPLRREAPVAGTRSPATGLCFVAGGSRLLYGTKSGALITHIIPGAPGFSSTPMTWEPPKGEDVIAVGWDRGLYLVTQQGSAIRSNWYSKRGTLRGQGAWHLPAEEEEKKGLVAGSVPGQFGVAIQSGGWGIVTSHGELVEMLSANRTYAVRRTNVAAVALHRGRMLTVERQMNEAYVEMLPAQAGASVKFPAPSLPAAPGSVKVQLFHPPQQKVGAMLDELAADKGAVTVRGIKPDAPVVFGFDNQADYTAAVGLQVTDGRWRVVRLRKTVEATDLSVPSGAKVYGVACADPGDLPALVAVEADGCTVALCTGRSVMRVVKAAAPIVRIAVSPFSSHLAYESADGQLCVYSLRRQQIVLRLQCS